MTKNPCLLLEFKQRGTASERHFKIAPAVVSGLRQPCVSIGHRDNFQIVRFRQTCLSPWPKLWFSMWMKQFPHGLEISCIIGTLLSILNVWFSPLAMSRAILSGRRAVTIGTIEHLTGSVQDSIAQHRTIWSLGSKVTRLRNTVLPQGQLNEQNYCTYLLHFCCGKLLIHAILT